MASEEKPTLFESYLSAIGWVASRAGGVLIGAVLARLGFAVADKYIIKPLSEGGDNG